MLSRDQVLQLIRDRVTHPATVRDLQRTLRIGTDERATFTRLVKALVADGALVQTRGNRVGLPDRMNLVVGRLTTHPSGYGFVVPEVTDERGDIYVAAANLLEAMHGDRVVARIESYKEGARAEGRVIRILERAHASVVGRYDLGEAGLGFVVPFDRRLLMDVHVPCGESLGAEPGDMVIVEISRWPSATRGPAGRVIEVLGGIDEPGIDTQIIIRKHGIPDVHSDRSIEEARRLGTVVKERDMHGRTDFRDRVVVTIDGETARDFDDAISIATLPNGHYWLGVHIADVAHYVRDGSALDEEARERGTSVYFPERAVHMFPAELATGLCSLRPRVDRLVQSCLMEIDRRGDVVRYELHDGVICSAARMTYTEVNAVITDRNPETMATYATLVPTFELMHELYAVLRDRRRRRGSIDFDLPEPYVILDPSGFIEDIVASERNVAHRLIEEFMLVANETVAQHLEDQDVPSLYRIHEAPDPLKVEQFEEFIATMGYSLAATGAAVRPKQFQKLIERIKDKPEERPIAALMLRTMQKARYDPANLGHYGLAASSYTHFTSPIRRYPDLVVHRTLRMARHGEMAGERHDEIADELPEVARHSSEMERRADEAERELVQWKKVRFMADKVGDEFDGYVTGVAAYGLFVELVAHYVEGLVHISTMADDYYRFLERAHTLRGENTHKVYRLGDKVRVQVVKVDMERRQVDLGLVEILDAVRRDERRRAAPRSKARPKAASHPARARRPGRRERAARKTGRRR